MKQLLIILITGSVVDFQLEEEILPVAELINRLCCLVLLKKGFFCIDDINSVKMMFSK